MIFLPPGIIVNFPRDLEKCALPETLTFDQLWTDYLHPLLQEYIQGMYDEESIMNRFAKAYGYKKPADGDADETTQD